jgi:hypothetical protein
MLIEICDFSTVFWGWIPSPLCPPLQGFRLNWNGWRTPRASPVRVREWRGAELGESRLVALPPPQSSTVFAIGGRRGVLMVAWNG